MMSQPRPVMTLLVILMFAVYNSMQMEEVQDWATFQAKLKANGKVVLFLDDTTNDKFYPYAEQTCNAHKCKCFYGKEPRTVTSSFYEALKNKMVPLYIFYNNNAQVYKLEGDEAEHASITAAFQKNC